MQATKSFVIIISLIALNYSCLAQKQAELDSLLLLLKSATDTNKVLVLGELCWQYRGINTNEALRYGKQGIELAKKLNFERGEANILNKMGIVYRNESEHAKSLECYDQALSLASKTNDLVEMAYAYNNISGVYEIKQNPAMHLFYSLKALSIFEQTNDIRGMGFASINVAVAQANEKKYNQALEYAKKSLVYRKKTGIASEIMITLRFIGKTYLEMKKYTLAKSYFYQAKEIYEKEKLNTGSYIYSLLAEAYLEEKNTDSALYFANKGYNTNKGLKQVGATLLDCYTLSKIYAATSDYENAHKYLYLAYLIRDSLSNEENAKLIAEHVFKQQQKEIVLADQEKKIQVKEIEKQRNQKKWILFSFFIGIVSVLVITLLIYRSRKKMEKAYHEISLANFEIQQQKEELKTQADALKATNDQLIEMDRFKQGLTSMLVHDLKNPLNAIINIPDNQIEKHLLRVKQSGKQMMNLVMNILDVHKYEETAMNLNLENHNVQKIIEKAVEEVLFLSDEKNIAIVNENKMDSVVKCDAEVIERVIVNILTNAIKFTPNYGKITIVSIPVFDNAVIDKAVSIKIDISDSGQGIPSDKLDFVFQKFGQVVAKNSGSMRSTGIGLSFCKLAIEAHGCEIGVVSQLGKGSTFWFTVPICDVGAQIQDVLTMGKHKLPDSDIWALSQSEKIEVQPFLSQLQNLMVYETTNIDQILKQIDADDKPNLLRWKIEMEDAVFTMKEEKYINLLTMIAL